jgi:hypothetical protein
VGIGVLGKRDRATRHAASVVCCRGTSHFELLSDLPAGLGSVISVFCDVATRYHLFTIASPYLQSPSMLTCLPCDHLLCRDRLALQPRRCSGHIAIRQFRIITPLPVIASITVAPVLATAPAAIACVFIVAEAAVEVLSRHLLRVLVVPEAACRRQTWEERRWLALGDLVLRVAC